MSVPQPYPEPDTLDAVESILARQPEPSPRPWRGMLPAASVSDSIRLAFEQIAREAK